MAMLAVMRLPRPLTQPSSTSVTAKSVAIALLSVGRIQVRRRITTTTLAPLAFALRIAALSVDSPLRSAPTDLEVRRSADLTTMDVRLALPPPSAPLECR